MVIKTAGSPDGDIQSVYSPALSLTTLDADLVVDWDLTTFAQSLNEMTFQLIFGLLPLVALARAACLSSGDQTTINNAFQAGGEGATVQLCPSSTFSTTDKILFTAANQELSTEGYPTDDTRATIQIATGTNFSGAIDGRWFNNVRVLNLKVDGNRRNAGLAAGDALIEMGGGASGQVVRQNVLTDTRSWSCMHFIGSGQDDNPCRQGEVSYNTIGPCGEDGKDPATGQARWADGLSIDCTETTVSHNDVSIRVHVNLILSILAKKIPLP